MTKYMKILSAVSILVLLILPLLMPITQAWSTTATTVVQSGEDDKKPQIIADGSGGVIVCWLERVTSTIHHIKAQRLNSDGVLQWGASGVTLASNVQHDGAEGYHKLCTDGAGGAFVAWRDGNSDPRSIYVRRVSSSGALEWAQLQISNQGGSQYIFDLCSDEAGGVVVVWQDDHAGNFNIYAQRIDSDGNKQWGENGTVVIEWSELQVTSRVIYNGSGWFYVAWADRRTGEWDIYLQLLNSTGGREWATGGLAICTAGGLQSIDELCSDGNGGVIMTWSDNRGPDYDIYAQRIAPNQTQFWGTDGKRVIGAPTAQTYSEICSDGAGGAILIWRDERGDGWDIFGQRVNSTGHDQWTANGTPIANEQNMQTEYDICRDGVGGAFMIWGDGRTGPAHQLYMQRVNASGYPLLGGNGTLMEPQTSQWQSNPALAYMTPGEVIMVWETETGSDKDLFAQIYPERTNDNGIPGFTIVYFFAALLAVVAISRKKLLS